MKTNYVKEMNTFLFRRSWGDVFKVLSNEDAGKLIKSIYRYADGEKVLLEEPADIVLESMYRMIINQLNYSSRKHYYRIKDMAPNAALNEDTALQGIQDE